MKLTVSLLLILINPVFSQDQIICTWWSKDKTGRTQIYKKNNKYFGKVVWLSEPNDKNGKPLIDKENPKSELRHRPILNLVVLTNLIYEQGDKEWTNGGAYDPESGKTYDCTVWIENNKLKLRGYWGWFFETQEWERYK